MEGLLMCLLGAILGAAWLAGRQSARIVIERIKELSRSEAVREAKRHGRVVRIASFAGFLVVFARGQLESSGFFIVAMVNLCLLSTMVYISAEISQLSAIWQAVERCGETKKPDNS